MNNVMVDLDYLISLFEDFDTTEIGIVVWTVLMKIQNEDLDTSFMPELEQRDLRALARALIFEYKTRKRKQDTVMAKIR